MEGKEGKSDGLGTAGGSPMDQAVHRAPFLCSVLHVSSLSSGTTARDSCQSH